MEKLSRVKKYEDLRKQIEENAETEMDLEKETSMETLHTIEPAHYKKVKIEDTLPKREQMEQFEEHTDTFQFKNEFLDEFINEVREYNLKKGNRLEDDTQMDILSQLKGSAPKRSQYISPLESEELTFGLEDTTASLSKEEIAKQVQELLQDETPLEEESMSGHKQEEKTAYEVKAVPMEEAFAKEESSQEKAEATMDLGSVLPQETMASDDVSKLVEQTQKMKLQLDSYEEELNDLNDGLDRTHRMLNIILCLLIVCLIAAIGFVVYYILQSGGVINAL